MLYYIFYPHENNKEPTEHVWLHTNSYYISRDNENTYSIIFQFPPLK